MIPDYPTTRIETFLAKLCGQDVELPEPQTAAELYLANIAGGTYALPEPFSRETLYLAKILGLDVEIPVPQTREDLYLAVIAGAEYELPPFPLSRAEAYLAEWAEGSGAVTLTGTLISFLASKSSPLLSLVCSISPVQAGSGDPSPDNVRPISGWSGTVNAYLAGENYFDATDSSGTDNAVAFSVDGGNHLTISGTASPSVARYSFALAHSVEVHNGDTLTFEWPGKDVREGNLLIYLFNGSTVVANKTIAYLYHAATFTFTEDNTITNIQFRSATGKAIDFDCHIVAYKGDKTTLTAAIPTPPGTVYGGTLDMVSGVLTVTKVRQHLYDLTWTRNASYAYPFFLSGDIADADKTLSKLTTMCDVYKSIENRNNSNFRTNNYEGKICFSASNAGQHLQAQDSSYTDETAFKNSLNGRYLVYDLATPLTYQLTPQEVNTLVGQNNVWGDAQTVTVTARHVQT